MHGIRGNAPWKGLNTHHSMKRKQKSFSILLTCLMLVVGVAGINYLWACGDRKALQSAEVKNAMGSGVPREAAKDYERPAPLGRGREMMLEKSQFVSSYHVQYLCPNYVCWRLSSERVNGKVQRSNNFHGDLAMDEKVRVETFDYNGSGYDRGHMCPAGDNKNSARAMDESFCMTNICPQNHQLNAGAWNDLEQQCRSWARNYGTLYICCGPIFGKEPRRVGQRKSMRIAVPDRFFKVLLSLGRVPKAIGFIYPNEACEGDMREYAVSVDEVEKVTGMDFFYQLDDQQEKELEKVCDPSMWGI